MELTEPDSGPVLPYLSAKRLLNAGTISCHAMGNGGASSLQLPLPYQIEKYPILKESCGGCAHPSGSAPFVLPSLLPIEQTPEKHQSERECGHADSQLPPSARCLRTGSLGQPRTATVLRHLDWLPVSMFLRQLVGSGQFSPDCNLKIIERILHQDQDCANRLI